MASSCPSIKLQFGNKKSNPNWSSSNCIIFLSPSAANVRLVGRPLVPALSLADLSCGLSLWRPSARPMDEQQQQQPFSCSRPFADSFCTPHFCTLHFCTLHAARPNASVAAPQTVCGGQPKSFECAPQAQSRRPTCRIVICIVHQFAPVPAQLWPPTFYTLPLALPSFFVGIAQPSVSSIRHPAA